MVEGMELDTEGVLVNVWVLTRAGRESGQVGLVAAYAALVDGSM